MKNLAENLAFLGAIWCNMMHLISTKRRFLGKKGGLVVCKRMADMLIGRMPFCSDSFYR